MRWIPCAVGGLGTGALLCLVGGVVLTEATVHVPRLHAAPPDIDPPRTVQIRAADGALLRGWMFTPTAPNGACVIVLHGIGGSRQDALRFAQLLLDNRYRALMPDLRAHGESGGVLVTYGVLEAGDVARWVDWLTGPEKCERVYGLGESRESCLQSLSIESRFRAVIAECP